MAFLPTMKITTQRPRLAAELRARSVVAASADLVTSPLTAVSLAPLAAGAVHVSLKPESVVDRVAVAGALRAALDKIGGKSRDVTLLVPDAAVRVTLLDFDALPSKPAEAAPVVRFRLKRTLPFDTDAAALSYQVMSQGRDGLRVLAVAMPSDLRDEYERVVREAGYDPGAVLPSTLGAIAALDPVEANAQLLLNVDEGSITTAIVRGGVVLLYRTVEFARMQPEPIPAAIGPLDDPRGISPVEAMAAVQSTVVASELEHLSDADEIARAISVAAAYYEDTLMAMPQEMLVAGTWPISELESIAREVAGDAMRLKEIVRTEDMLTGAAGVPRNLLAGVRGALKG